MRKLKQLAIATFILGSLAGGAQAQGFIGGAIGQSHVNVDLNIDKTATGAKVFGGYRFSNGLALEATYFYYGKLTESVPSASASLEGTAPALGVAYFDESDKVVFAFRA